MTDSTNETRDGADPKVGGITIDDPWSTDLDDALDAKPSATDPTATVVRVTIASASGLVPTGSAIDTAARGRVATRSRGGRRDGAGGRGGDRAVEWGSTAMVLSGTAAVACSWSPWSRGTPRAARPASPGRAALEQALQGRTPSPGELAELGDAHRSRRGGARHGDPRLRRGGREAREVGARLRPQRDPLVTARRAPQGPRADGGPVPGRSPTGGGRAGGRRTRRRRVRRRLG